MKAFLSKYIHLIACMLVLTVIYVYGYINTELPEIVSTIPLSFQIKSDDSDMEISLYQADTNLYYVFLPSYVQMEQLEINAPSHSDISIGTSRVFNGMSCADFTIDKEYEFKVNNRTDMKLQFIKSANVATLYINTATGNMERVHNDKDYEQPSSILLVSEDGHDLYFDNKCYLTGRGNSTWNSEKKPYSLSLSSEQSLLNMAPSANWVLLANAFDETNLRNKIVYDLADKVGLVWSPSCEYIDIYINGSYNGLYLLTERIETDSNHLDIDTQNGDFLCKFDFWAREESLRHPFVTTTSPRMVEITRPKELTPSEESRIQNMVNTLEQTILISPDTADLSSLDLDSWAFRYLIDEISANGDADSASSYFYYKDNMFFAGPLWDYDSTFGSSIRNENPMAFTAKNNKGQYSPSPYYNSLYKNDTFYNHMTQMYQDKFLPILDSLVNTDIYALSSKISSASQMNSIRWGTLFDQTTSNISTVDELINYINLRIAFLNSAWIDNVDYCSVQFEKGTKNYYYNVAVVNGERLDESHLSEDASNTIWYIANTNEIFDITEPIIEDIVLVSSSNN